MNNYCKHLKKRKNKPYCKLLDKEISLSECNSINAENKCREYKTKKEDNSFYKSNSNQINKNAQSSIKKQVKNTKMHNKSKKLTKLERNRFSVFTTNKDKCMFCPAATNLTWHEIYSGRNRKNSMKDGFCLRMCLNCHREYQDDTNFNNFWHRETQLYFEEHYDTREDFISRYRRNYLD